MLPGVLTDTVDSLDGNIKDAEQRITKNQDEIAKTKTEIAGALAKSGVELTPEQVDLLLDSVLSGDLVRLVAVFNAAKVIDTPARQADDRGGRQHELGAQVFRHARGAVRHAGARAGLGRSPRSTPITCRSSTPSCKDITRGAGQDGQAAAGREPPRPEARARRPTATRRSWPTTPPRATAAICSSSASRSPRRARAPCTTCASPTTPTRRSRRASSCKNLMRDSAASFEAIQKLEAPTFDQIFKNEELRQEFENLTRRLDAPSS